MSRDVFEKDPFKARSEFAGASGDLGPQVPLVVLTEPLAGGAEWLAGVSGKQGVDAACPWPGVEGAQIVPDWGRGEVSGPLAGDDGLSRVFLPFDKAAGVEIRLGEHEAEIEAAATGAQG